MPPQITCPHCGSTITLENRKEVDFEKIMHALGKSPRTFTELLTMTNLPRKTLSLRLKELCASGSIMKDGGYHLNPSNVSANGTFSKRNGKMNPTILHIKKNVQWIPAALIICLVVVAFGSAMMISPPAPATSPRPTIANFYYTPSLNIAPGTDLTFVSYSQGSIINYYWDFGDGLSLAYGKIVTHTYVAEGTYTITLTVTDAHGSTTSIQKTADVSSPPAPQPTTQIKFTISPDPTMINWGWENAWIVGKTLTFSASAFNEANGYTPNYSWTFGDGANGAGVIVSHAYEQAGIYTVTLTVVDLNGTVQLLTEQVQILSMPTATIYVDPLPTQYQIGDILTLNIMVSDVTDLFAWQVGMTFNPAVLQCITVTNPSNAVSNATTPTSAFTEGDFLKKGGSTMWFPGAVENGMIIAHGDTLLNPETNPATPVSGSGTLATVTFKVIGDGALDIHLTSVILLQLKDLSLSEFPVYVAT